MFVLSKEGIEFVKKELVRYETKRSAIIPALYCVQKENNGWVSPSAVVYLAALMDLPVVWINEVLNFYTMFNSKPIGKLHIQVCTNVTCSMNGGQKIIEKIEKHFDVKQNKINSGQTITLSCVECLGSCNTAPMMQINQTNYENLTESSAIKIIEDLSNAI